MDSGKHIKIVIVPVYNETEERRLELFLRENKFLFSIPINPPPTIFDEPNVGQG